jgi:cysteine desulfurase / selenocysteine lyase
MISTKLDIEAIRKDFPILNRQVNGKPLVYLDNGATSQKPKQVIDALVKYYSEQNSNIHRGVHTLSREVTEMYEGVRKTFAHFINAASDQEIIFNTGTTAGINMVAYCLGKMYFKKGDVVLISEMEHHSNILPWQRLRDEHGVDLKVIPVLENGELDMDAFHLLLNEKVKFLAITHVSNVLGTINPIKEITSKVHAAGGLVLVDGAQAAPHMQIDVQDLDVDFYVYGMHKVYGPTGVGMLYAKKALLEKMPPYILGGGIITEVTFEKTTYAEAPLKFEAGTPDIANVIASAAALNYVTDIGFEAIANHEHELLVYATEHLLKIEGLKIFGTSENKASVLSFNVEGIHPYDIGMILDKQGVAVRTGHHCTQPLMQKFGLQGTVRAAFAVYNTFEELGIFISATQKAVKMLR